MPETIITGWLIFFSPAVAIHLLFTFNKKALREGTRGVIRKPPEKGLPYLLRIPRKDKSHLALGLSDGGN